MANQIVWVDIPVLDLDRAVRFYSAVLGSPVQKQEHPGMTIGLLPGSDPDVSGFGFELTFRVTCKAREAKPPNWALNFLQNLGRSPSRRLLEGIAGDQAERACGSVIA